MTLILVLVAIQWELADLLYTFLFTLFLSAVAHAVVRGVTSSSGSTQELTLAIINLIVATTLGIVVGNSIWLLDFVPLFTAWRWGTIRTSATAGKKGPQVGTSPLRDLNLR
jgi:hypothetical protein